MIRYVKIYMYVHIHHEYIPKWTHTLYILEKEMNVKLPIAKI